jgi:uncharacterized protein (DUF433 family)
MKTTDRIEIIPDVCNGKPVITGTRIPVAVIIEQLAEGISWEEIIESYPELNKKDIQAVLIYARDYIEQSEITEIHA